MKGKGIPEMENTVETATTQELVSKVHMLESLLTLESETEVYRELRATALELAKRVVATPPDVWTAGYNVGYEARGKDAEARLHELERENARLRSALDEANEKARKATVVIPLRFGEPDRNTVQIMDGVSNVLRLHGIKHDLRTLNSDLATALNQTTVIKNEVLYARDELKRLGFLNGEKDWLLGFQWLVTEHTMNTDKTYHRIINDVESELNRVFVRPTGPINAAWITGSVAQLVTSEIQRRGAPPQPTYSTEYVTSLETTIRAMATHLSPIPLRQSFMNDGPRLIDLAKHAAHSHKRIEALHRAVDKSGFVMLSNIATLPGVTHYRILTVPRGVVVPTGFDNGIIINQTTISNALDRLAKELK